MRLMGVAAMPSAMNSVCAVWITRRMFCSRSSLRFTVCTSLRKVAYSMPCFRAVCNRKCASCGNICALHGATQCGMFTADREIPPRRSGCLGPDLCRGLFLGPVSPVIKKGQISFEAGLTPSSSPAALYPFPCRILTIDSKKSPLPRQRALRLGCSVLADGSRIRQPSWPWPALRAPCCPRRRGQWQG